MADEILIFEDQPIRVSFATKGYTFYKGQTPSGSLGDPIEAFSKLIAVKGKEKVAVPTVSDLKGRVVIESPEEALEFVRLFTSLQTHYLFRDSQYIEPTAEEEREKNLSLKPASAKQENGTFIIERNLVSRDGKLIRATERVGPEGEYAVVKTEVINEHSPVAYPIYQ